MKSKTSEKQSEMGRFGEPDNYPCVVRRVPSHVSWRQAHGTAGGNVCRRVSAWLTGAVLFVVATGVRAHDPVFALGPHVLYKGGIEVAPHFEQDEKGEERERQTVLELSYGLTGDWAVGFEIGYKELSEPGKDEDGTDDLRVFTKYRFWRHDTVGAQESTAVLLALKPDSGSDRVTSGASAGLVGLAYGYEGRKWYRWASVRYLVNGEDNTGLRRSNRLFVDLAGGIRPRPTGYLEPDTVWLLELNSEFTGRAERNAIELSNSGGTEVFLTPGIFWTYRNFAFKAGVQIPIFDDLNGEQESSDYRARLVLEWHL